MGLLVDRHESDNGRLGESFLHPGFETPSMSADSSLPASFESGNPLDLFASDGEPQSQETARKPWNPENNDQRVVAVPWSQSKPPETSTGISLDRIRQIGPLRFVEAVALIQGVCDEVPATPSRGVPELSGIFLTQSGDVIPSGPGSAEPAARQAARLLHELVSPEATPAAGRLFIGRWTSSDSASLSEFASELAYFARPNGPELRAAIYTHSAGNASLPPVSLSAPVAAVVASVPRPKESQRSPAAEDPRMAWIHSHRKQVIGATAIAAAVLATGLTVWIWPSSVAGEQAAPSPVLATGNQIEETTGKSTPAPPTDGNSRPGVKAAAHAGNPQNRSRTSSTPAVPRRPAQATNPLPARETPDAPELLAAGSLPLAVNLQAKAIRDTRIYTAADSGVEPPALLSAEIPEWLIQGFVVRQNSVEMLINERGEVQRVKMLGPPQRMPDVMLLSRAKEWVFRPATKDGIAVPYRLIFSWNVTP